MKRYTKTDVVQKFAEIVRATFSGPVIITDRRKDSHVIMTIEHYEELMDQLHDQEMTSRNDAPTSEQD